MADKVGASLVNVLLVASSSELRNDLKGRIEKVFGEGSVFPVETMEDAIKADKSKAFQAYVIDGDFFAYMAGERVLNRLGEHTYYLTGSEVVINAVRTEGGKAFRKAEADVLEYIVTQMRIDFGLLSM